jgi:uncharacterized RDD family membrane protein YckC
MPGRGAFAVNSDPNRGFNPYAPPSPDADLLLGGGIGADTSEHILASRAARLGAYVLDMILAIPIFAGFFVLLTFTRALDGGVYAVPWMDDSKFLGGVVLIMSIWALGLVGYQWYLTATRGQTLGKKWLGIRIVKVDGSPVDFISGVILRSWVTGVLGFIPYINCCISLVGYLMIFGEEKRCLHDHIAGTKVIVVPPGSD